MSNLKKVTILFIMVSIASFTAIAQKPTTEERLIRLEEGQKRLSQRIEDTNRRISDLRQDINKRFDDLRFWIQISLGMLVLVIAGLVTQFLLVWQRLIRSETKLKEHLSETEKNRLIAFQKEEIEMLKKRVERLETV